MVQRADDPVREAAASGASRSSGSRDGRERRRNRGGRGDRNRRGPSVPDILYHATIERRVQASLDVGVLERGDGRNVFFSVHESQAWQVAHRQRERPVVLVVDASRAQRSGVRFSRSRQGLWQAKAVPSRFLLNTLGGYAEQVSAGGFPLFVGESGPELLLIRVRRRSGLTWEVAKGKLELGETPWQAAIREVQEEIGCEMDLSVSADMGFIRYGFRTPEGAPRLKTVHIYLLQTPERAFDFDPASAEGIEDVGWFTPEAAVKAVSHRSLRPMVWRVRRRLESGRFHF